MLVNLSLGMGRLIPKAELTLTLIPTTMVVPAWIRYS